MSGEQQKLKEECAICKCEMTDEKTTSCGHSFCKECIKTWCNNHNSCPLCRKDILNEIIPKQERIEMRRRQRRQRVAASRELPRNFPISREQILSMISESEAERLLTNYDNLSAVTLQILEDNVAFLRNFNI